MAGQFTAIVIPPGQSRFKSAVRHALGKVQAGAVLSLFRAGRSGAFAADRYGQQNKQNQAKSWAKPAFAKQGYLWGNDLFSHHGRSIDISSLVIKPPLFHLALMIQKTASPRLFCFGLGYSAQRLAHRLMAKGWTVAGTTRSRQAAEKLRKDGIEAFVFDDDQPLVDPALAFKGTSHLLTCVKPEDGIDPVLAVHQAEILAIPTLEWVGYLSTTGVYGNTQGAWVDEESPLTPTSERNSWRVDAEAKWLLLQQEQALPVHIFRLAGIYGPGRSQFDSLASGRARRLERTGQVFSRIHVDDIGGGVMASMANPNPGRVYNVCDDLPENPAVVVEHAAELKGITPPPLVPFEDADLSPMARSFYLDNRRVSNKRLRDELGYDFAYPTYKEGLAAILAELD